MRFAQLLFASAFCLALSSCQPASRNQERQAADSPLFGPVDIRIHPFTSVKDWTNDGEVDGVEVMLELMDRFGDPTKATGSVIFELYPYYANHPDPRGPRIAAWTGSLQTLEDQRLHWNRISRTYTFQLQSEQVRGSRSYVLQVWFDHAGRKMTKEIILEAPEAKEGKSDKSSAQPSTTQPSTGPTTGPATRPATGPIK